MTVATLTQVQQSQPLSQVTLIAESWHEQAVVAAAAMEEAAKTAKIVARQNAERATTRAAIFAPFLVALLLSLVWSECHFANFGGFIGKLGSLLPLLLVIQPVANYFQKHDIVSH